MVPVIPTMINGLFDSFTAVKNNSEQFQTLVFGFVNVLNCQLSPQNYQESLTVVAACLNSPLFSPPQVRRHRLGLCQLSQAGVSQRRLRC